MWADPYIETERTTCLDRKGQNCVTFQKKFNSYTYVSVDNDTIKIVMEI